MNRSILLIAAAFGLQASTIDVIGQHYVTLGTGETLVAEFSSQFFEDNFGVPTSVVFTSRGGTVPSGGVVNGLYPDASLQVRFESLSGPQSYNAGVIPVAFAHFRITSGQQVLWEDDGFTAGTGLHFAPHILTGGGVRVRVKNLGVPLTFGNPVHHAIEDTQIGVIFARNGASQGAGQALTAVITTDEPVPEPATYALMGAGLLAIISRKRWSM